MNVASNAEFELVSSLVKVDGKKRITLGSSADVAAEGFNIYKNKLGQIVLDPVTTVPMYERWIFQNKGAHTSVKQGLKESAEGKTTDLGSFGQFAEEE